MRHRGRALPGRVAGRWQRLGLRWCPWFYRDPWFYGALLAGLGFWLGLWLAVPIRPLPLSQILSPAFFLLVVGHPALEEVLFRGYLQSYCSKQPWGQRTWRGVTLANAGTALAFTLGHLWTHPPLWALAVLAPALVFGYSRERYASLYPGLLLHIFYNAGYFGLVGLP